MTLRRALALIGLLWLLTGVYVVQVDEQAVVRRFGAVVANRMPPGLHFGLPWGIDRVDRVRVREQKRLTIGFETADQTLGRENSAARSECFTGDQNLVNVDLLIQYTIHDPRAYLFAATNSTQLLQQIAEAAVTATVASRPVDMLLTTGKLEAQEELRRRTQQGADASGLGLTITAASITNVTPPLAVSDAFREVASARADRDRFIQEARSYANATLPAAHGDAARLGEEAVGYRDSTSLKAQGDASRFRKSEAAYRLAPGVSGTRLYFETMEQILPRLKIISVDRDGKQNPVDLNLLPRPSGAPTPRATEPSDATENKPTATPTPTPASVISQGGSSSNGGQPSTP